MKKNLIFKSVSVMSAFAIVFSLTSVTSYADEPTHTVIDGSTQAEKPEIIEGNIDTTDDSFALGVINAGEVEVKGYVSLDCGDSASATAVFADGGSSVKIDQGVGSTRDGITADNGSQVIVTGPLEADRKGIIADNGSKVQLNGDIRQSGIGVEASGNGTQVSIEGSINATTTGIEAYNNSVVNVKEITGPETGVMIDNATVIVDGNICADKGGAVMVYGGELIVKGDVSGADGGVALDMTHPAKDDYSVIVEGTISSEKGYALIIAPPASGTATSDLELLLYKLEAPEGKAIGIAGQDDDSPLVEAVKDAINYIIKFKNTDNAGTISGYDDDFEFLGYKTMKHDGSVNVSVKSGYYLNASKAVSVTQNEDGTYTIRLKDGYYGGINLQILKKAIEDSTGEKVVIDYEEQEPSVSEPPAPAVVVTNGSGAFIAPVSDAVAPARTVSFKLSETTPSQMKEAIVNNIATTPAGGVLRIETDSVSCFDEAMLEAFEKNGNIDIELIFMHKGQRMRIFIPRGTNIRTLLDEKGYCGYLRLAGILGSQII